MAHAELLTTMARCKVGFNYHPQEVRFQVSLPTKVLEYIAAGIPIVSTALAPLRELLHGIKACCLVESNDPEDYASAIIRFLSRPAEAHSVGVAGRELIRQELNWERCEANALLSLYNRLTLKSGHNDKR